MCRQNNDIPFPSNRTVSSPASKLGMGIVVHFTIGMLTEQYFTLLVMYFFRIKQTVASKNMLNKNICILSLLIAAKVLRILGESISETLLTAVIIFRIFYFTLLTLDC